MINPLATDWPIKQRSEICNATHRPFTAGEVFYTLLYREGDGFRREDLSEEAWRDRNENIQPFSFWKTKFEPAPPPAPEALPKENAEQLFRRLIAQPEPPANACFVLAVMLERKRVLKQVRTEIANGDRLLIYEHRENGDVFIEPRSAIAPERARTGAGPGSNAATRRCCRVSGWNSGHPA